MSVVVKSTCSGEQSLRSVSSGLGPLGACERKHFKALCTWNHTVYSFVRLTSFMQQYTYTFDISFLCFDSLIFFYYWTDFSVWLYHWLFDSCKISCSHVCLMAQLCLTLCKPMDYSPPGSSVHGVSPGKNIGVGCHVLLLGIFPTQGSNPGVLHCRWILHHLSHQGHWNG